MARIGENRKVYMPVVEIDRSMREYTTITEVDERGRMLMPLAVRKALGIENRRALVEIRVSIVDAKKEESENPLQAHAPELLLASA